MIYSKSFFSNPSDEISFIMQQCRQLYQNCIRVTLFLNIRTEVFYFSILYKKLGLYVDRYLVENFKLNHCIFLHPDSLFKKMTILSNS